MVVVVNLRSSSNSRINIVAPEGVYLNENTRQHVHLLRHLASHTPRSLRDHLPWEEFIFLAKMKRFPTICRRQKNLAWHMRD